MAKRALGRGLDALIAKGETPNDRIESESLSDSGQPRVAVVRRQLLYGNPNQPRKEFGEEQLQELASSIREKGILQPILVEDDGKGGYMIVAGERRYRAAALAGLDEVPIIVRSFSDEDRLEIALIENIQRENLSPIEEARAYRQLVDQYALSQDEVARRLGKSRSVVANALRLLNLPEEVRDALGAGVLSSGHARAVLAVNRGDEAQIEMFRTIERFELSVREAEALAKLINSGLSAPEAVPSLRGISPEPTTESGSEVAADILAMTQGGQRSSGGDSSSSPPRSPELAELEQRLIEIFGTKVQLRGSESQGKIEISYFSMDDLERVFEILEKASS